MDAIKGKEVYPHLYLEEFGIYDGMNGNFTVDREYSDAEIDNISKKLSAFHCAPIKLKKQWYCEPIKSWRLVFKYNRR